MKNYTKDNLLDDVSDFDTNWKERDFVADIRDFLHAKRRKVLIVSGLRGTGKTVGMYQTVLKEDALYLCCQDGENETAIDYIKAINETNKETVIIDEYTWIKERKEIRLERKLDTFVQNGKKIILTGTESAVLESLRNQDLIHRAECLHVTRFSFHEFKRLNADRLPKKSKDVYDMFLKEGGIFKGYISTTTKGIDDYIQNSIVENLYAYIGNVATLPKEKIKSATYTVIFNAIYDTINKKEQGRQIFTQSAKDKLEELGIEDISVPCSPYTVQSVGEVLESIGVLVKVSNIIPRSKNDIRFYIVNPAITWNLAKIIDPDLDENIFLGRLFEASVLVELAYSKSDDHLLYFYEEANGQIDAVIAPYLSDSTLTIFEVKHKDLISQFDIYRNKWSVLRNQVEDAITDVFTDNDIENRYIVYTGKPGYLMKEEDCRLKEYLLVGLDDKLRRFWQFEKNKNEIIQDLKMNFAENFKESYDKIRKEDISEEDACKKALQTVFVPRVTSMLDAMKAIETCCEKAKAEPGNFALGIIQKAAKENPKAFKFANTDEENVKLL